MIPVRKEVTVQKGKIVHNYQFPPNISPIRGIRKIIKKLEKNHETLIELTIHGNTAEGVHALTAKHPEYFDSTRVTQESKEWNFGDPHPKWVLTPRWALDPEGELTAKQILLGHHPDTQFTEIDGTPFATIPANPDIPLEQERLWLINGCGSDLFSIDMTTSTRESHQGFIIPHPEEHLAVQRLAETLRAFPKAS